MSTIDQTIQSLFTKLSERKAKVASLEAEIAKSWKTTGAFRLIGASSTTNIQTASVDQLEEVAAHVVILANAMSEASAKLSRPGVQKIQGYKSEDWFSDLQKRLAAIDVRDEKKQLEALETRLNSVLSPEERRRIEVELLAKELG
jgi:hypothetical protein